MRVVHLAELNDTGHVEPRCGPWGPMDADWTDIANDATCSGCRITIRDEAAARALAPPELAQGGAP
jgi:hypothetical protein